MVTAVIIYDRFAEGTLVYYSPSKFEAITYLTEENPLPPAKEIVENTVRYDPGFGEESCWFTSCSKALSIFLYGLVIQISVKIVT